MKYAKLILTIAPWLIAIALALFLFQECSGSRKKIKELNESQKEIAKVKKDLDRSAFEHSQDSAQKEKEIELASTIIDKMQAELDKANKAFKQQGAVVKRLSSQIHIPHDCDSAGIVRAVVDSLISVIDQMSLSYAGMEANMTILIEQQTIKDSLLVAQRDAAYAELAKARDALAKMFVEHEHMKDDLVKALKKVKNKGFWTRIFAGTTAASLIYAAFK